MEGRVDRMLASRSSAEIAENSLELSIKGLVKDTLSVKQARRTEQKRGKSAGVQRTIPVNIRREIDTRRISVGSAKARLAAPGPKQTDSSLRIGLPDDGCDDEVFEDNEPLSRPASAVIEEVAQRRASDATSDMSNYIPDRTAADTGGQQSIDMYLTNRGKTTANNFLTERDKSALKVGRLIMSTLFEQQQEAPTTSDAISRFFFDAWLNKNGSSLQKADTLSIELMSTLQKSKAETAMRQEKCESARYDPSPEQEAAEIQGQEFSVGLAFAALDYVVQEFGEANPVLREIRDILAPCIFMEPPTFEESMELCGRVDSSSRRPSRIGAGAVLHTYEEQDDDDISLCSAAVQSMEVENPGRIRSLGQQYANRQTWYGDMSAVHEHANHADHALEEMSAEVRRLEEDIVVTAQQHKKEVLILENRIEDIVEGNKEFVRKYEASEAVLAQKEKEVRSAQVALGNETKALLDCQQRERVLQGKMASIGDQMDLKLDALNTEINDLKAQMERLVRVKTEDDEVIAGLVAGKRDADAVFQEQAKQKVKYDEKLKQRRTKDGPVVSRLGERAKTYHEYIECTEGFLSDQYTRNNQRLQAQGKELEVLRATIREMKQAHEALDQAKLDSEKLIRQEMATNLTIKDNEIACIEDKVRRAELEIVKYSEKYGVEKDKAECARILLASKEVDWKEEKERADDLQNKARLEIVSLKKHTQDAIQLAETQKEQIGSMQSLYEETKFSLDACREKIVTLEEQVAKQTVELDHLDQVRQSNEKEISTLSETLAKNTAEIARHQKGNEMFEDHVNELTSQKEQLVLQAVKAKELLQTTEAALEAQTEKTEAFISYRNTVLNDLQHRKHVLFGSEETLEHMGKIFEPYAKYFQSLEGYMAGVKAEEEAEAAKVAAEKATADAKAAEEATKAAQIAEGKGSDTEEDEAYYKQEKRKRERGRTVSGCSDDSSSPGSWKRKVPTVENGCQTDGCEGLGVLMDQFHGIDFSHIVGDSNDYDLGQFSSSTEVDFGGEGGDEELETEIRTPPRRLSFKETDDRREVVGADSDMPGNSDTTHSPPTSTTAATEKDDNVMESMGSLDGGASVELESAGKSERAADSPSKTKDKDSKAKENEEAAYASSTGSHKEAGGTATMRKEPQDALSPRKPANDGVENGAQKRNAPASRTIAVSAKEAEDVVLESEFDPHIDEEIGKLEKKINRAFKAGADKKAKRSIDKEFKNVLLLLAREKLCFMDMERKYNIYKAEVIFEKKLNSNLKTQVGDMRVEVVNMKRALKEASSGPGSLAVSQAPTRRGSTQSMVSAYAGSFLNDQEKMESDEEELQEVATHYDSSEVDRDHPEVLSSAVVEHDTAVSQTSSTASSTSTKQAPQRVAHPAAVGRRLSKAPKRPVADKKLTYLGSDGQLHGTRNIGDRMHHDEKNKHEVLRAHAHEHELDEKVVKKKVRNAESGNSIPIPQFESRGMMTENDTVKQLAGQKKPPKDVAPFINFIRQHEKRYALEVGKLSIMLREGSGLMQRVIHVLESLVPASFPSNLAPVLDIAKVQEIIMVIINDIEDNEWIFDNNLSAAEVTAVFGSDLDPVFVSSQMRQFTTYNLDLVKSHQFLGAPVDVDITNIRRRQSMQAMRRNPSTGSSMKLNHSMSSKQVVNTVVEEDPTEVDMSRRPQRADSAAWLTGPSVGAKPTGTSVAQIAENVARSMSECSVGSGGISVLSAPGDDGSASGSVPLNAQGSRSQEVLSVQPVVSAPVPIAPVGTDKAASQSPDKSVCSAVSEKSPLNTPEKERGPSPERNTSDASGRHASPTPLSLPRSMSMSPKLSSGREGSQRFGSPSLGRESSKKFTTDASGKVAPPTTIMMREGPEDDEHKRDSIVSIIEALREHFRFHKSAGGDWKALLYRHDGTVDTNVSLVGYDADETIACLKEMVEGLKKEHSKNQSTMMAHIKKITDVLGNQNAQIAEFKRTIQLYKSGQLKPDVDLAEMKKLNQEMSTYAADGVSLPYYLELESAVQKTIHIMTSLCSFNVGTVAEGVIGDKMTEPVTELMTIEINKSNTADTFRSEVLQNRDSNSELPGSTEGVGIDSLLTSSLAESMSAGSFERKPKQQKHGSLYNEPSLAITAPKGRVYRKLVSRRLVEGYLEHKSIAAEEDEVPGFLVSNSLSQRNRRGWKKTDIIPALTQNDYKVLQTRHKTTTSNLLELCDKLAAKILCIDPSTTANIMKKLVPKIKQAMMPKRIAEEELQVGIDDDESMTTSKPKPVVHEEDSFLNFESGIDTSQISDNFDLAGGGNSFVAETALGYNAEINEHVHEILRLQEKLKKLNALDDTTADTVVNRAKNCYKLPSRSLRELFPTPANEKEIFSDSKHKSLGEFMGNGEKGLEDYKDPFDQPKVELKAPPMLSKIGHQEAIATAAQVAANKNFIEGVGGNAVHSGRINNDDGLSTFRKRLDKLPLALAKAATEKKLASGPMSTITTSSGEALPFPIFDTFNHSETKSFGHLTRTKKGKTSL